MKKKRRIFLISGISIYNKTLRCNYNAFFEEESKMAVIVLISCVSKKLNHKAKAKDLYISQLFQKVYNMQSYLNLIKFSSFLLNMG